MCSRRLQWRLARTGYVRVARPILETRWEGLALPAGRRCARLLLLTLFGLKPVRSSFCRSITLASSGGGRSPAAPAGGAYQVSTAQRGVSARSRSWHPSNGCVYCVCRSRAGTSFVPPTGAGLTFRSLSFQRIIVKRASHDIAIGCA